MNYTMAKINLSPEARAAKCAYQKAWARRNPEKIQQYMTNYWERKAAEMNSPEIKARELSTKGYTQRQIAEELGISLGAVNAILNKS